MSRPGSMVIRLSDLAASANPIRVIAGYAGTAEILVTGISHDSRMVEPGYLFVALRGARDDGHLFIGEAVSRGAAAVVVDSGWEGSADIPVIVVADTLAAMAPISAAFYGNPQKSLEIYGVTGTNGKTTTTFLLEAALDPCAVLGTIEYRIGDRVLDRGGNTTPLSMELFGHLRTMADHGVDRAVMEVSSHALSLHRVDGISFAGAVFTNITPEHLDFHATMDEYLAAKERLFDMTPEGPLCIGTVSPGGRSLFTKLSASGRRVVAFGPGAKKLWETVGNDRGGWLEALNFSMGSWGLEADLRYRLPEIGEGSTGVASKLTGTFNLLNISGAVSVLLEIGMAPGFVSERVGSVKRVPGRFDPVRRNGITAVVDYAHTGDSLENALTALRELRNFEGGRGRIITVFGCGGDRDRTKRPVMGEIASRLSDLVVITSDNPRTENPLAIIAEIIAGTDPARPGLYEVEDRRSAIRRAIEMATPGDFVLVAGKGHEDYQILGREKIHFDDREEIEKAFGGID